MAEAICEKISDGSLPTDCGGSQSRRGLGHNAPETIPWETRGPL